MENIDHYSINFAKYFIDMFDIEDQDLIDFFVKLYKKNELILFKNNEWEVLKEIMNNIIDIDFKKIGGFYMVSTESLGEISIDNKIEIEYELMRIPPNESMEKIGEIPIATKISRMDDFDWFLYNLILEKDAVIIFNLNTYMNYIYNPAHKNEDTYISEYYTKNDIVIMRLSEFNRITPCLGIRYEKKIVLYAENIEIQAIIIGGSDGQPIGDIMTKCRRIPGSFYYKK